MGDKKKIVTGNPIFNAINEKVEKNSSTPAKKSAEEIVSSWTSPEGREANKEIKEKAKDALKQTKKNSASENARGVLSLGYGPVRAGTVKKSEQTVISGNPFEKVRNDTQKNLDSLSKKFDEATKKLGNMHALNSKYPAYKVYSDEQIKAQTKEVEQLGNIVASLHKSRGETEEMYGVRSKVSNALYKVADMETPRSIDRVTIPESIRQQAYPEYDDALYRKKADDIAVKYIGKEYLANENEVLDFFSKWMANYSAGKLGEAYGDSGYSYAEKPTDARKYYKDTVENVQNAFIGRNSGTVGKGGVISKNLASYLPQLEGQVKNGLPLALIGGAIGMAVGAPALGVKLGYSLGVGRYSYEQMYGMSFNSLSKITDYETAKKLARDEGLVSGGVETLDTLWDIASLGGGAVLKALGKETVKKIGKTSLFKLLGGYALNVIGEGGQESVQELITIANERRAQKGDTNSGLVGLVGETVSLINEIYMGKNDAALKRAKEAGIEGMKTSLVIGGASLGLNTATANVLGRNANAGVDKEQDDIYFLIEHDDDGHEYWQIESDKDIFKGLETTKELQKAAYDYILHGYKGEEVYGLIDGENLKFIRRSAEEYLYGEASEELSNKEYRQKMRMSPSVVDLIENASIRYDAPDHKEHKMFPGGFKNYQGRVGIDDVIFRYIVRVGKARNDKIFYDINLEVDGRVPRAKSTSLIKKTSTSNTSSISQNIENGNKKISTNEDFLGSIADGDIQNMKGVEVTPEVQSKLSNYEKVMAKMGFKVVYEMHRDVPDRTIGYVDFKNREVYISPDHISDALLTHELTHVIDKGYDGAYVKSLISFLKKQMSSEWEEKSREIKDKYEKLTSENEGFTYNERTIEAETLAEMCSLFTTEEYIKRAAAMDVGTVRQIGVMLRYMGAKIRMLFGDKTTAKKLEIASLKWQMALYRAQKKGAANGGEGISFMYAGEKSKTANRSLLNLAKEMSINGDEPSVIWKETGWRLGADGKWRFEIDDSKAVLKSIPSEAKSLKLGDILVHDELYKAYPQLRNVEVEFRDDMRRIDKGNYNSGDNVIKLNLKNNEVEMKDAVIHEVQHAVQNVEGYEAGGNVQSALMRLRRNTITKLLSESPYFKKVCKERTPAEVVEYVDNYLKKKYNEKDIEDIAYRAYRDLYGEREARDTSARQDMSAEQRLDDFSEYEKGALLGNEYSEYEIQADTILQKVYPFDMVHEVSSLEDGTRHSKKLEAGDILRREVASGETSEIGNRQSVEGVESDEYESPRRRAKSAEEILDEIDIVDELLNDTSIDAEERAELRVKKKKLERSYADKRRSLSGELKSLDERTAKKNEKKEESVPSFKYEDAVKAYKETGDASGIPDKKSAKMTQKYYQERADSALLALGDVEGDLAAGRYESEAERLEMETRRDALKTQWREAVSKNEVMKQVLDILDEIDTVARPNHKWVRDASVELSDKQNIIKDGLYKTNDVERNFRNFFGKYFKTAYEKVLKPFYDSKKNYAEGVTEYSKRLREEIVDGLKIKAGSRESAAIMWLGEGKKPISKKAGAELADYTYEDCVKEFGEKRASDIKKAAEIFREMYDELLDKINETRAKIYPSNPDKLVAKRSDYFHHFQEMGKGFSGLRNILNTNIGIDPMLVGTSEYTKPKSKFAGFMQRRLGERTEYDAVLGFLKYLPAAQYSIHIDPNIVNFRSLAYDLASAKASENNGAGNPNANVFIEYLQKYANSLAGKTVSHGDRGWISYAGRTSLAVISWLNNMTKASAVLGNVNSVLSQVTNVKNMIGKISHQSDAVRGAMETLAGINPKSKIASRYNESGFLKERFLQDSLDDYSVAKWNFKKVMQTPGHFAAWMLGFADEIGTRITWNAAYNEAIRKNIKDASQYADSFTRQCVAGRGIGEDALVFKSQMAKLFLPFRTEVLNDLRVQQDILFGKEYDIWEKNGEKITPDMSEKKRYEILKNRVLKVARSKSLVTENVTEEDVKRLETTQKSVASKILQKLSRDFGVTRAYESSDIELEFEFSNSSLKESINKQKKNYTEFAKMMSCFDEVVENAVGIEVHKDKYAGTERADTTLKQTYVLASAFSDGKDMYPVKLLVKEFKDKPNKLYVAVVVNKKENTIMEQALQENATSYPQVFSEEDAFSVRTLHQNDEQVPYTASSVISISQLLNGVNDKDFDKYIPKQFKKNQKQTEFDKIVAMGDADSNDISPRKLTRVKNIMQLFVASAVINAVIAAIKSDEFDPLEEAEEGYEEGGVFGAIESVFKDYADGIGDPVAFDPIYDIATGVYQGITEGEGIGGKVGKAALRVGQNLFGDAVSNNPFSTVAMSALGIDSEISDFLFNGSVYTPGGAGMPLAGNVARSLAEVVDEDYLSAVVAIAKGFIPMGTQIDRSVKGFYEYKKGYATNEAAYERMAGEDGELKYLIEPGFWSGFRSVLFGSGAFSKESDAFYNDKSRKFSEEEQAEILSHSDYKTRKVTFDDILAMNKYESTEEKDKRKEERAKEFFDAHPEGVLYDLYMSGEESAIPYKNVAGEITYTDSKTDKKYTLKLKAADAEKLTKEVSDKIAERFARAEHSESFKALSREEQVKYLDAVVNSEYKQAKVKALYDSGQMGYSDYFRLEANYKEATAKRDRALFVDDASVQVEFNAADVVGQYITYSDVSISEEGYKQLDEWYEYSSTRKADSVDIELMRLSNVTGSDINVSGNPYGIISYTKSGVDYKIAMPDNKIYALCDEVDRAVRSALYSLFEKATYKSATAESQKDMVASVKRKVRDSIKDKYKARYKSVKITEFDKIVAMK